MAVPLITLTTDFGTVDSYAAEMKGVILQINPQATIVDVSHQVEPQRVSQGAFVLGSAFPYFPLGTVHIAVVDPGVGTSRRTILLATDEGFFLGPDNGVLTYAVRDSPEYSVASQNVGFLEAIEVPKPIGSVAYALSNQDFWRHPVSDTFHGRDIFAPVAAYISLGVLPEDVGEPLDSLVCLSIPHVRREGDKMVGYVINVDRFGNLITTIGGSVLPPGGMEVLLKGHRITGLSHSYLSGPDVMAIIGSHGNLEIAARNGNASREMSVGVGEKVLIGSLT